MRKLALDRLDIWDNFFVASAPGSWSGTMPVNRDGQKSADQYLEIKRIV
jgi:hypothetical protein